MGRTPVTTKAVERFGLFSEPVSAHPFSSSSPLTPPLLSSNLKPRHALWRLSPPHRLAAWIELHQPRPTDDIRPNPWLLVVSLNSTAKENGSSKLHPYRLLNKRVSAALGRHRSARTAPRSGPATPSLRLAVRRPFPPRHQPNVVEQWLLVVVHTQCLNRQRAATQSPLRLLLETDPREQTQNNL